MGVRSLPKLLLDMLTIREYFIDLAWISWERSEVRLGDFVPESDRIENQITIKTAAAGGCGARIAGAPSASAEHERPIF